MNLYKNLVLHITSHSDYLCYELEKIVIESEKNWQGDAKIYKKNKK